MTSTNTYPSFLTIIKHATLPSTNTFIKETINELQEDFPIMVQAEEQTQGRGRERRKWLSARGLGLYTSFAFFVEQRENLPFLALTSGLAVIDTLRHLGIVNSNLQLKWPNDILCNKKKIAGVLIENIVQAEELTSICGIGINVNHAPQDFSADLLTRAISLKMVVKKEFQPDRIAPLMANHFFQWLNKLKSGATDLIVQKCNDYSQFMQNQEITLHQQNGIIRGLFVGISHNGGLMIKGKDDIIHSHYSGEIQEISSNPD